MVSASQIREVVAKFLSHNDSDRFVRELAALSYNIHKDGDAEAVALARAIELRMADFRSGCIQKTAFLNSLRQLTETSVASNNRVYAQFSDPVNRLVEVESGFRGWAASSGTLPSVEFGSVRLFQS